MAFCGYLRQSTAVDLPVGPFLDETDGKTAETALTLTQPDIRLKKGAANWGQKNAAQTLTHEENGYYEVSLDTTDTNTLGLLSMAVHESGALPVRQDYLVISAAAYDLMYGTLPQGLVFYGTLSAGASGSATLPGSASATDNFYNGCVIAPISGTGAGQAPRTIIGYTGSSKLAAVSPAWTVTPDGTTVVIVFAAPPAVTDVTSLPGVDVKRINAATVQGDGTSGNLWRG